MEINSTHKKWKVKAVLPQQQEFMERIEVQIESKRHLIKGFFYHQNKDQDQSIDTNANYDLCCQEWKESKSKTWLPYQWTTPYICMPQFNDSSPNINKHTSLTKEIMQIYKTGW